MRTVSAIYEQGVFRPTEPVDLPEHCAVDLELHVRGVDATPQDSAARPIEEVIAEIVADVPQEAWDGLPTDLSQHHDHYLYGVPKD